MKKVMCLILLVSGSGCRTRDDGLRVCRALLEDAHRQDGHRGLSFSDLFGGINRLGGEAVFVSRCNDSVQDEVRACSEYEADSDRDIDCRWRRVLPAAQAFALRVIQGEVQ